MSSHTFSKKIDQKEYLKKYLSGDKQHKKKKKKEKNQPRDKREKVRIIDDDAVANTNEIVIDEELLLVGEDAPQIVGEYIEEQVNGDEKKAKWKAIGVKEEPSDEEANVGRRNVKLENEDLWGKKAADIKLEPDHLVERNCHSSKLRQQSVDASPPRRPRNGVNRNVSPRERGKRRNDSPEAADKRKQYPIKKERRSLSSDMSPPRRRRQSPDLSPRRQRNKAEDNSPPRRGRKISDDSSPPRRPRRASPDNSPPRKPRHASRDQSPVRRRRPSPNDHTPPRKNSNYPRRQTRSPSPSHRNHRNPFAQNNERPYESRRDSDQSPPRRKHTSQLDTSSLRRDSRKSPSPRPAIKREKQSPRRRRSQDLSPQRRRARRDSRDNSPRRRRSPQHTPPIGKHSRDVSPPRRRRSRDKDSPPRKRSPDFKTNRQESRASLSPPPTHKSKQIKTLDGKKAGLQDAVSLRQENEKRRAEEDRMFAKMSKDQSGRDAELNVRSTGRKGRRARRAEEEQEEDPEVRREKEERERHKKEQFDRWGKGLKQIEDHRQKIAEFEHESNKPLARYRDDEDLERHLKEREYADDPMLAYMRQKRKEQEKAENKPVVPRYEGPFPENRFGIRPGYRWDGVDRSNGFEQKLFNVQNERRAVQDDAYKYSVEDM